MSLLTILEAPHPLLKRRTEPVREVNGDLRRLIDDMLETMYAAPGIGLAAPQVGHGLRLAVVDVSETKDAPLRLINPIVTKRSASKVTLEEGCLSLPGQFADVSRPEAVTVRYEDESGEVHEVEADGMLARCLQHEIDHLDGVLFTDHLSILKRNMIMRRLTKQKRQRA